MKKTRWLNSTVLGIGLASLFSDWSHEIATTVMPAFLATMGVAAAWLGIIEGVSDGLSSFAKMGSGYYTDRLRRRKPIAIVGYLVTALGTASFSLGSTAGDIGDSPADGRSHDTRADRLRGPDPL
jgi:MFS family permease